MAGREPADVPEPAGRGDNGGPSRRELHPLPRPLVELYGLLAVLFVIVPEWMAGSALANLPDGRRGSPLPQATQAWRKLPELRLATMGMAELRLLARRQRICGYASLGRDGLTARLLRRLRRRRLPPAPL